MDALQQFQASHMNEEQAYYAGVAGLYEVGRIRRDRPRDLRDLNRWLSKWTSAQVHRHHAGDGGQLYWHDEPVMFYRETVDLVFRADSRTYGEWLEDYCDRHAKAVRNL